MVLPPFPYFRRHYTADFSFVNDEGRRNGKETEKEPKKHGKSGRNPHTWNRGVSHMIPTDGTQTFRRDWGFWIGQHGFIWDSAAGNLHRGHLLLHPAPQPAEIAAFSPSRQRTGTGKATKTADAAAQRTAGGKSSPRQVFGHRGSGGRDQIPESDPLRQKSAARHHLRPSGHRKDLRRPSGAGSSQKEPGNALSLQRALH